jgi:hypothetical protein
MTIEKAYQSYVQAVYGHTKISKDQDIELRKAFFAGIGWLLNNITGPLLDNEEMALNFLDNISQEFGLFLEDVKSEIN